MAWNFLQVVEHGAHSDQLYPVPEGRGVGVELTPEDTSVVVHPIVGLKVIRQSENGPWLPTLNVLRTKGKVLISDRRVAVTFEKFVPKDLSSFRPIDLVQPDGTHAKRPKRMLVGHVLLGQVRRVGVRNANLGKGVKDAPNDGHGSLILAAVDGTDSFEGRASFSDDMVAIEIIVAAGVDPVAVANDVLARVVNSRRQSPLFDIDQPTRGAYADMVRDGFSPPPGEVETHEFVPSTPVRPDRQVVIAHHLTPPTDTSPVPTMQPTPSVPMPSVPMTSLPAPTLAQPTLPAPNEPSPTQPSPTQPTPAPSDVPVASPGDRDVMAPPPAAPALPDPLVPAPPPPGSSAEWRPDPFSRFELRYWDGFGWTEHVHGNGRQTTDPPR